VKRLGQQSVLAVEKRDSGLVAGSLDAKDQHGTMYETPTDAPAERRR